MSATCSVYWYCEFDCRPPRRMGGGFCSETRRPGIAFSFGRSSAMISSIDVLALDFGTRRSEMTPVLSAPRPPPTNEKNVATLGSFDTMSIAARWWRDHVGERDSLRRLEADADLARDLRSG